MKLDMFDGFPCIILVPVTLMVIRSLKYRHMAAATPFIIHLGIQIMWQGQ